MKCFFYYDVDVEVKSNEIVACTLDLLFFLNYSFVFICRDDFV